MSSQKYYGLVTDKGLAKLRAAAQGTAPLMLSHMAFGDGNGAETAPTGGANALVNERYRAPLSDKRPHETNPSILYVEAIIPPGVGGWTLREAGIYDSDGDLIVIAKTPVMDVALLAEGATTEGLVRLPITFESTQSAQFLIDPTVLLATQSWVIDRIISRPFITVESVTLKTPPTNPTAFSLYVIPTGATGAWANKTGQMAHWHGTWQFANAPIAKVVGASDTGKYWRRTATGWAEFTASETETGLLRLASDAEHKAGISRTVAAHPAGIAAQVQAGAWNYGTVGGTANALTVNLSLPPLSWNALIGASIRFLTTQANTEPAPTLSVNGLEPKTLVRPGGGQIKAGEIPPKAMIEVVFDGLQLQVVTLEPQSITPWTILAFRTSGIFPWTVPDGVYWTFAETIGGGGGGGGGYNSTGVYAGEGGAAGGRDYDWFRVTPGDTIYITVGAGGKGGPPRGTGADGGTSSFGKMLTATGGQGGRFADMGTTYARVGGVGSGRNGQQGGYGGVIIPNGASLALGGIGGSVPGGGQGGCLSPTGPAPGIEPGGGGGGAGGTGNLSGGNGAVGRVTLTF